MTIAIQTAANDTNPIIDIEEDALQAALFDLYAPISFAEGNEGNEDNEGNENNEGDEGNEGDENDEDRAFRDA